MYNLQKKAQKEGNQKKREKKENNWTVAAKRQFVKKNGS